MRTYMKVFYLLVSCYAVLYRNTFSFQAASLQIVSRHNNDPAAPRESINIMSLLVKGYADKVQSREGVL